VCTPSPPACCVQRSLPPSGLLLSEPSRKHAVTQQRRGGALLAGHSKC
jgi:hypothetical protein